MVGDVLRSREPDRPDPRLSAAQLARVEQALLAGAMANGFDPDLWTLEQVAVVITQLTGVRYHPSYVWASCAGGWAGPCSGREPLGVSQLRWLSR
jgi:transposase